jgi:hypothetical protein
MLRISLFAVTCVAVTNSVSAQSLTERSKAASAEGLTRAFLGYCGQEAGRGNKIVSLAKAIGLGPLPDEMAALCDPPSSDVRVECFFENKGDGAPYFLSVTFQTLEGQEMTTCTVANPYIETKKVVAALSSFASLNEPDLQETQMGQRTRLWFTDETAQGSYVILNDAEPMGYGGATLSLVAPSKE